MDNATRGNAAMDNAARFRPRAELEADRADCLAYQPASRTDREQGAIDAYDWLLGRRTAPLSGGAGLSGGAAAGTAPPSRGPAATGGGIAVTPTHAVAEARLADDAARGAAGAPPVTGVDARWTESYVLGVRDALLWALRARRASPGGRDDVTGLPGAEAAGTGDASVGDARPGDAGTSTAAGPTPAGFAVVRRREPRYRRTWDG